LLEDRGGGLQRDEESLALDEARIARQETSQVAAMLPDFAGIFFR
jgi:hypothetical protein